MNDTPLTLSASDITHYSSTHDVLVVGYGIAGACAALEARRTGADVMVIERASAGGGASAVSSGLFYLGGGTGVQKACNVEDDADNMYRFMIASMGSENADMIRMYCDQNVEHFNWLEAQGIPFERSYHQGKAVFLLSSEGLLSTGNEKLWPYREIARPAARGHQVQEEGDSPCRLAMERLIQRCLDEGVNATYDSRATALIIDDGNNSIVGVQIRKNGELLNLRAHKGVVLATGGFVMNHDMVASNLQTSPTLEPLGTPYSDGAGIRLGSAAGAATDAMNGLIATASIYPPGQLIKGIIVNRNGKRFVAEDSYHGRTAAFIAEQPQQRAYLIVDSEIFAYPEIESARHQLIDGFESIEEMESQLKLPPGSLTQTLADYNLHAAASRDPDFHKHSDWLKPLDKGPWAAFDISYNRSSYLFMTLGGLKINCNAQVLDREGNAIKGLYGAGACTAHIPKSGKSYASGMSLGPGSFFGRVAGRHCASAAQ
ncbi:MAG: FAD-binding protein [Gammaproteobacteria bacterium]|uniref:FAD-binding protein n=1 Tax=Pseudomaricurvus alcaniphilus TaxID=1166482 RepID=UPI0014091CD7|nr:FAD-binding protein [Pseudomaricurvus alcaniphilus]MBR9911797.1 FAD-binding protein [Gammaproteobacteria bacterium]NHN39226.1 FAD-binding protein [Pseudomaricurvus alcaniphilus]